MNRFYTGTDPSRAWAQKSNNWSGRNFLKWKSDEYDKLWDQVLVETNTEKAATMWQQLNDLVVKDFAVGAAGGPQVRERQVEAADRPEPRPFDNETWNIADWKKA